MRTAGMINVSEKAESYVRKTFRGRPTSPEGIFTVFAESEERELAFVSKFFDARLQKPSVRYVTSEEIGKGKAAGYGDINDKTKEISLFVDNIFGAITNFVMDIGAQFAVFPAHEFVHLHDLTHTPLFEAKSKISRRVNELMTRIREKRSSRLFRRLTENPELLWELERKEAINQALEARAERVAWLSLAKKLAPSRKGADANAPHTASGTSGPYAWGASMNARWYIRKLNGWHYDCTLFIEYLEKKFGHAEAWEATGKIPPVSRMEIQTPALYAKRVFGKSL